MANSTDPTLHRQSEQQLIEHVKRLLDDDRLRVDTTRGRRPVTSLIRTVTQTDRGVELKRLMSEMDLPDRELQARMPAGQSLEVILSHRRLLLFKQPVGRVLVVCASPTRALLAGQAPQPMNAQEVQKILTGLPPAPRGTPTTLVLLSTSGFALEAHEQAERRADRTLILVQPNDAGGWSVFGPAETKALNDLFDPEAEQDKRARLRQQIESDRADLLSGGLAADRLATKAQLPLQFVESELKTYAKAHPGLLAKRLDGRIVLFSESAAPQIAGNSGGAGGLGGASGGSDMPLLDRFRTLFSRKGENEKKIAVLAERRAALSQQSERSYEDVAALEKKETDLRQQFRQSDSPLTKRRLTSQLLQLRKDIERRQQLLSVLNQQINVVGTHLHNLELVRQGQTAKLPDSEELARDAAAAEDVLARLEADTEMAASISGITQAGMTAEEQALYEELEREATAKPAPERTPAAAPPQAAATPQRAPSPASPARGQPQRSEPEPG